MKLWKVRVRVDGVDAKHNHILVNDGASEDILGMILASYPNAQRVDFCLDRAETAQPSDSLIVKNGR